MKKITAILLAIVLTASVCVFAYAADSLTEQMVKMDDENLLIVFMAAGQELAKRGYLPEDFYEKAVAVPEKTIKDLAAGTYVIGQDIPEGTYQIICTGTESEDLGNAYSSLGSAFAALGDDDGYSAAMQSLGGMFGALYGMKVEVVGGYGEVQKTVELKKNETVNLTLTMGTALKISEGKCILEKIG